MDAVTTGVSGARELRSVLSKLDSKQQSLIFGHSVPMPIVVRMRDYGANESYRELGFRDESDLRREMERDAGDLLAAGRPPAFAGVDCNLGEAARFHPWQESGATVI